MINSNIHRFLSRNTETTEQGFDMLIKAELSKKQKSFVDRAISTANECGSVAYELELQDGIKLMSELKDIK